LFGIELIILFYDPSWMLQVSEFNNFLLIDAAYIEVRLVAIKSAYFSPQTYTTFHFSRTLPLKIYWKEKKWFEFLVFNKQNLNFLFSYFCAKSKLEELQGGKVVHVTSHKCNLVEELQGGKVVHVTSHKCKNWRSYKVARLYT